MNPNENASFFNDIACLVTGVVFLLGLLVLAVRLWFFQVQEVSGFRDEAVRQSECRVQLAGLRGRILDRNGAMLAGNRKTVSIDCDVAYFQSNSWSGTCERVQAAITSLACSMGVASPIDGEKIVRHVRNARAMPLSVWRDADAKTLAAFLERAAINPGFDVSEGEERVYPEGQAAAHLLGYTGRSRGEEESGDRKFAYYFPEMRGRGGVELYYDGFLRGSPGEMTITVDARRLKTSSRILTEPRRGPNLSLALDLRLQKAVERELNGLKGACVAIDPRNGEVLALASAPGYDPNEFIPALEPELYRRLADDPSKPLLNRASGGAYAPGSTFKPITALAGLKSGVPSDLVHYCDGVFELGRMHLRCSRRWGHEWLNMRSALKMSCNPYFCDLGCDIGTNAIVSAAKAFGLGSKTGIDFCVDMAGVVPDGEWKRRMYGERWYPGDLAQMSIGQGMLLVSPLQMARVAAAIGTGYLVTPHVMKGQEPELTTLPFSDAQLKVVRDGMWQVVNGCDGAGKKNGTGRRAGEEAGFELCGKTGTAEVGRGATRRKNTWFIASAPVEKPRLAIAMVIENGESGGGTTAPKVRRVLRIAADCGILGKRGF